MKSLRNKRRKAIIRKYKFVYREVQKKIPKNTEIRFSSVGFKHLVYRGKTHRSVKELRHRLSLIPLIPEIISQCKEPYEIRGQKEMIGGRILPVRYYAFDLETDDGFVRMVARQVDEQIPLFQSLIEIK